MATTYSPLYVLLSVMVAVIASYVSLDLVHNLTEARGRARGVWLVFGACAMGFGIWSMHFVGMLAVEMPGMEMAYDIPLVLLSILIAVGASGLALWTVSRTAIRLRAIMVGGLLMAIGIAGMHYIGMYAMRMDARIEWNLSWVALSILIAVLASFTALLVSFHLRDKSERIGQKLFASLIMGVAIAGMHYTGMIAATFIHEDRPVNLGSEVMVSDSLTWLILAVTLVILGLSLGSSFLGRILNRWNLRAEDSLRESEERFRLLVEAIKDYAIYMLDTQGRITLWTSGASAVTGFSSDETMGRHFSMFYPHRDVENKTPNLELKVARESGHYESEGLRLRKDGSVYWANVVISPLFDRDGRLRGYSKVTRDISALKESEGRMRRLNEDLEKRVSERTRELQTRETQLRLITNALPVLVAQVDADERVQFANEAFCNCLGQRFDQIVGRSLEEVWGPIYRDYQQYYKRALTGQVTTYERPSTLHAQQLYFNVTLVPECREDGTTTGFIVVASDISKHKEIEAELKNAKEAAEVGSATKSAFLANMSHEIRTPLGAILGFSELLVHSEMSPSERHNSIEVIKRNGRLLSGIINDILDISKVEAGKLEIEKLDIPFSEIIVEIGSLFSLDATEKNLQLSVATQGLVPSFVQTDPVRLRQILLNIVGNAIKFTEKGKIDILVRGQISPTDGREKLAFVVSDTGRGISPEQVGRLFAPFSQADISTTRRFGGTGLGLVLAKKMAQALGGDLVLSESAPGHGSVFTVTIDPGTAPRILFAENPAADLPAPANAEEDLTPNLEAYKILVVDDSIDNQMLAQHFLRKTRAELVFAGNGLEALEKARTATFDLILMDIQMPLMDGLEATKQLRLGGFTKSIVALTAHAMAEERRRCLENGFDDHLSKPIHREALLGVVARQIRGDSALMKGI